MELFVFCELDFINNNKSFEKTIDRKREKTKTTTTTGNKAHWLRFYGGRESRLYRLHEQTHKTQLFEMISVASMPHRMPVYGIICVEYSWSAAQKNNQHYCLTFMPLAMLFLSMFRKQPKNNDNNNRCMEDEREKRNMSLGRNCRKITRVATVKL